ncbi:hypothetical protein J6590_001844 [Homalodisca vitripennis]|nr:hypothetical protein J6590_001844 [Homalodisca vitripennis]
MFETLRFSLCGTLGNDRRTVLAACNDMRVTPSMYNQCRCVGVPPSAPLSLAVRHLFGPRRFQRTDFRPALEASREPHIGQRPARRCPKCERGVPSLVDGNADAAWTVVYKWFIDQVVLRLRVYSESRTTNDGVRLLFPGKVWIYTRLPTFVSNCQLIRTRVANSTCNCSTRQFFISTIYPPRTSSFLQRAAFRAGLGLC